MAVSLSDELVIELERAGEQPLRVENPRNHRQYFIIPEEMYPLGSSEVVFAENGEWTDEKNARRFALIDKEIAGTLATEEVRELHNLQHQIDDYLRRVAPLPFSAIRGLHEELLRSLKGT